MRKLFHYLQDLCGVNFDIVWSFDNSVFFDFSSLPNNILKISHIVDLNQNFQTKKAAKTVDFCFCTTKLIKDRLLKFNPRVFKINHGFNNQPLNVGSISLPGNSGIKALYAGNLGMPFIDWVLIHHIAKENPEVNFVFIGPNKDVLIEDFHQNVAKQSILTLANSFFMGRLESKDLLPYLVAADILLVAYQEKHHADQSNPHKLMEYLGSGKMIVATNTSEYQAVAEKRLILMSNNNSEFNTLFEIAISQLDDWNSEASQANRRSYALDNTYDKQISRIEDLLTNL